MNKIISIILALALPLSAIGAGLTQSTTNGFAVNETNTGVLNLNGVSNKAGVASNVAAMVMSPAGGNNGDTDHANKTPQYEGQLGLAYYGNKEFFLYGSGSTTVGDWVHGFVFPTGITQVGSSNGMAVAATSSTIWNFCGSAAGRAASGDHVFISRNWSTNRNSSGGGFAIAIMYQGADGNMSTWGELDASWQHVPTNRIASLIPGWVEFPFNTGPNVKGLAVCSPTIGPDSGNYSLGMFDGTRKVFAVPFWVAGAYQPGDTGWRDAFTVNPASGFVAAHTNFGVGSKSFFTNDLRFDTKLVSGNGSGMEFHFYGGNGGTFSFGAGATDAYDLTVNTGITLRNAGQKIQWLNSTILTNFANGTLGVYDSSFGLGTVKANVLSDTLTVSVASTLTGETTFGSGGVAANGGGFKHARITTGSVLGGANVSITNTWTTAFADEDYTVTASVHEATPNGLSMYLIHVESITASNVAVRVSNNAVGALTGTVHIIAVHD